ncbi:hypothetical protein PaG_02578 [Moesziomyces aphidis]|uniref:Cell cycle checkpoint protein RAD17 n=1 Tax=Moesziomyces aphidis TaxID=84754 RepID=W3VMW8_MOEAP|nr:hypothetical protein PaG_02578 [Moesziomyces aphidis]
MKTRHTHPHHPRPANLGRTASLAVMPPKHSRPLVRTLSASSASTSQPASSARTKKLKQNKLDFSFHSTSSSSTGSRPLTKTPSFSLPFTNSKGKEKTTASDAVDEHPSALPKAALDDESTLPDDGTFLWSERLAPQNSEELAVHPRKIAQVRTWLEEAFSNKPVLARHRKLLALTGPAGSAKSATIKALASPADLDYDILEWHNDTPSFDPTSAFVPGSSFADRFTDFLSKAAKFPSLQLQSSAHADIDESSAGAFASSSLDTLDSSAAAAKRNRLVLLQDLPNLHHAPTRSLFQAALEQHLAQSTLLTSRGVPNVPIVIIVTESAPREDEDGWVAGASSSTWRDRIASIVDTRTVLGERIRRNPAYAEVRYNPIAPSILLKGLKRAIDQAPAQLLRKNKPKAGLPKDILDLLGAIANDANGDLRAALNCLQFMGASRPQLDHMAKETASKPGRRGRTGVGRMLPLVAGRESSLALFHALGRVLYNKRAGDPGEEAASTTANSLVENGADSDGDDDAEYAELQSRLRRAMRSIVESDASERATAWGLPVHLSHMERGASRVNVDQLWADLPVDASLFALYLHQNAVQFCSDVEQCEAVEEAFSAADAMAPLHEQLRHSAVAAYYAFGIATRGVLLALPSPVPRTGQKLGKAAWWDVHKKLAEVMRAVEELRAPALSKRPALGEGLETGPRLRRTQFGNPAVGVDGFDRADAGLGDEAVSSVVSTSNSVTLVTEVLPLLAKIRPGGTAEQLCRLRFDRAGVADIASSVMDQHDTGLDATDQNEESSAQEERQSKRIRLQDVRDEPDVVDAGELSDDQIADF